MNTKLRSLVVPLFLSVMILSTASSAHASVFDWLSAKDSKASSDIKTTSLSFDKIYGDIQGVKTQDSQLETIGRAIKATSSPKTAFKIKAASAALQTYTVKATGYSSTPDQTDDSPFITATGAYVHDGIIAANFLPFGTRIKIPSVFGDKIFTVEDRMNKKYWLNIDVWFPERQQALEFGARNVVIEIVS